MLTLDPAQSAFERVTEHIAKLPFACVYQGGHHDIWCNGVLHRKTAGGFCHHDKPLSSHVEYKTFMCDCRYWKKFHANVAELESLNARA